MRVFIVSLLVVAGLACSAQAGLFSSDKTLTTEYNKINEHLVKSVSSSDPNVNMAEVKNYLEANKGAKKLTKALEQIVALEGLAKKENCNDQDLAVIEANLAGAQIKALNTQIIRRIDNLISHFVLDYNEVCYEVYQQFIAQKNEELGAEVMNPIIRVAHAFREQILVRHFSGNEWCESLDAERSIKKFSPLEPLRELAQLNNDADIQYLWKVPDEISGKKVKNPVKIGELYNKYIKPICLQYQDKIGSTIAKSIERDIFLRTAEGVKERCGAIAIDRVAAHICSLVATNDKINQNAIKNMAYDIN